MGTSFLKKEERLRKQAEYAVARQQKAREAAVQIPKFPTVQDPDEILSLYMKKRSMLTTSDAASAYFHVGWRLRRWASKRGRDPYAIRQEAVELRKDVTSGAPYMTSQCLAKSLLGAAYTRSADTIMISSLCEAAAVKASELFTVREVSNCLYALGSLERADAVLLPKLLSRVAAEAPMMHGIEMVMAANGLAQLRIAPPTALAALSKAAIPKLDQFSGSELAQVCRLAHPA